MAIDSFKVQTKHYETQHKLLEYINDAIENDWTPQNIADLALAYRYVSGGAQPGAPILKK